MSSFLIILMHSWSERGAFLIGRILFPIVFYLTLDHSSKVSIMGKGELRIILKLLIIYFFRFIINRQHEARELVWEIVNNMKAMSSSPGWQLHLTRTLVCCVSVLAIVKCDLDNIETGDRQHFESHASSPAFGDFSKDHHRADEVHKHSQEDIATAQGKNY